MQYKEFEKILADTFLIQKKGLGAFRARLRHLRNLGVPDIPRQGSGNTAIYDTDDLLAALVAIQLQTLGCAPAVSAEFATFTQGKFDLVKWSELDVFLWVINIPGAVDKLKELEKPLKFERSPAGSARVPIPEGIIGSVLMKNPVGGITKASVVVGAELASKFVANANASSLINLSAYLRALPKDH
jgi:hypothetical protein